MMYKTDDIGWICNRKSKKCQRKLFLLLICLVCLTGCKEKNRTVTVIDGNIKTYVEVSDGDSVQDILKAAEIFIDEKDVLTPELDCELTAEESEILITRHTKVDVSVDGTVINLELTGKKVEDALQLANVELGEFDYINHDLSAYLTDGMCIDVIRRQQVFLQEGDDKVTCLTKATTVEELLTEQGIVLDKRDRIQPAMETAIRADMQVIIERVAVKRVTVIEPIEFGTKIQYSASMYIDQSIEQSPGINGKKEVVYDITYVNGKEEGRKKVRESVLAQAVDQVVIKGTKHRRTVVSRQRVDDCDGSGHGYYIITYSDGTVEYQDY